MIGDILYGIWASSPVAITLIGLAWALGILAAFFVRPGAPSGWSVHDLPIESVISALRAAVGRVRRVRTSLAKADVRPIPVLPRSVEPEQALEPAPAESNVVQLDRYRKAS